MSERNEDRRRDRLSDGRGWRVFRSLRVKLVALLALAMLPAATLAYLQALSNYRQVSALAEETVLQAAVLAAREEEKGVIAARRVLTTLAVLPEIEDRVPGRCDAILAAVRSTSASFNSLAMTNDRGEIVCSSPPASGRQNVSDRPWYRSVMNRGAFTVTSKAVDMDSGKRVMVVGLPMFDSERTITGALFLAVGTKGLQDVIVETETTVVGNVALVDRAGNVIANGADQSAEPGWLPDSGFLGANLAGAPRSMRITDESADVGIIAVAPLLQGDLYVVVGGARGSPASGAVWRLAGAIGFPLIMWLIALAVAWFAVDRMVVRPILRLERTAVAFAAGKRSVRAAGLADMPAEIGRLGRTMNMMADTLGVREDDLQQALNEQKTLLKELHHRVKNNLQVIASLLNLQIHRATGKTERRALRTTQDRIYALAKVHDSLNHDSGDGLLRLDETLTQITEHISRAQDPPGKSVRVHYDMDPVKTSSKTAVPIALLLTEAISSALDATRPDDVPGDLWISIKRLDDETLVLAVESDGPPAKARAVDGNDLSAKLAAGFVKQLGGQATLETTNGYRLRVTIPHHG